MRTILATLCLTAFGACAAPGKQVPSMLIEHYGHRYCLMYVKAQQQSEIPELMLVEVSGGCPELTEE